MMVAMFTSNSEDELIVWFPFGRATVDYHIEPNIEDYDEREGNQNYPLPI